MLKVKDQYCIFNAKHKHIHTCIHDNNNKDVTEDKIKNFFKYLIHPLFKERTINEQG